MAEFKDLKKNREVDRHSSLIAPAPFLDNENIMRVGGRLEAADITFDAKHPLLLPYNDPITKLIFEQGHKDNIHSGPQALLAVMRQRYWAIKGKTVARNIVQNCVRCTRAKPRLIQQIMGNLSPLLWTGEHSL